MKRKIVLLTVFSAVALMSCKKEDKIDKNTVSGVTNLMDDGTWRITYYFDDNDETLNFDGYNFTFGADNLLTAEHGSTNVSGVWSITDSNSDDDDLNELDFNISFLSPPNFEELSDDWEIIEKTETMIKLTDVSGGGSGTDYLTFTKN